MRCSIDINLHPYENLASPRVVSGTQPHLFGIEA